MQLLRNPRAGAVAPPPTTAPPAGPFERPADLHRLLDGYAPTPLLDVPSLADRIGVGRVLVKHEAHRFGLPAFKIIGASWAVHRVLAGRHAGVGGADAPVTTFDDLRERYAGLGAITLVTATDGNHGRAVARAARWFGLGADIYMPAGTVAARVEAIESEGARVTVVDGDYDHAVATAAATAGDDRLVVSDTSWPGYDQIPVWIAEGYTTIFEEIDQQLAALGLAAPDAVTVPVGVGALAQTALAHWPAPPSGTVTVSVEPVGADCLAASLAAGTPVSTPGPHHSIMAGMNCGTVSEVAWPTMLARTDWAAVIEDDHAVDAMRSLAREGIVVGETGAAAAAAWLAIAGEPGALDQMGLGPDSVVLCLCTEGATDPANYEAIVGMPPGDVAGR